MTARLRRLRHDESGFSLLEVVVAMFVFAILATVTLGLAVRSSQTANSNIRRTTAANIATSQIETVRNQSIADIPDGATTYWATADGAILPDAASAPANAYFTIRQTAAYSTSPGGTNACNETGNSLAYKRVTVQVTWPGMGTVQPVRADTLKAVGVGSLDATLGTLAVQVLGANGSGVAGITVALNNGLSQVTGDDGCVVFTALAPGTYRATLNEAGYVGQGNTQSLTTGGSTVYANRVTRLPIYYDKARSANVSLAAPTGNAVTPTGLSIQVSSNYVTTPVTLLDCLLQATACANNVPGTLSNLFPANYTVKAGTCFETDASAAPVSLVPDSSDGTTVAVPVGVVNVTVTDQAGNRLPNRAVTITHAAQLLVTNGCQTGETLTTKTGADGTVAVAVPYGSWTVGTTALGSTTLGLVLSKSVTLTSTARTATVALVAS